MNDNRFTLDYSAADNNEAERIMRKYTGAEKQYSDIEKLRMLDRKAETPGRITALTVGIIGTLVMGSGMSLIMVFGNMVVGIILGIAGISIMLTAYPLYKKITKSSREKVRDEIIALSDKIRNGET